MSRRHLVDLRTTTSGSQAKDPPNIPSLRLSVHEVRPRSTEAAAESHDGGWPAVEVDFKSIYAFDVLCRLRPEVVSTSDWHDSATIVRGAPSFGQPDRSHNRLGIFHHPFTSEIIKVPNAGCARFWIEFEFCKVKEYMRLEKLS
jgi:hypothetical protein